MRRSHDCEQRREGKRWQAEGLACKKCNARHSGWLLLPQGQASQWPRMSPSHTVHLAHFAALTWLAAPSPSVAAFSCRTHIPHDMQLRSCLSSILSKGFANGVLSVLAAYGKNCPQLNTKACDCCTLQHLGGYYKEIKLPWANLVSANLVSASFRLWSSRFIATGIAIIVSARPLVMVILHHYRQLLCNHNVLNHAHTLVYKAARSRRRQATFVAA